MPRHIVAPEHIQTPITPDTLDVGGFAVRMTQAGHARSTIIDARASTRERWGEEPIEDTFSIVGPDFELTLVDELRAAIQKRGFARTRKEFERLEDELDAEPFGATNIDEFKDTDAGLWARVVHAVTGPLADLIPGKQLVLKGTGRDMQATREYLEIGGPSRTRLVDQFRATLEAARRQQKEFPDGIGGCVFIGDVYGVLRYKDDKGEIKEWMLMERARGPSIPNVQIALARLSRNAPSKAPGFEVERDPALAELLYQGPLGRHYARPTERFSELAEVIGDRLGYSSFDTPFADLNGHNILREDTDNGPRYTIIDVKSH